MFSLVDLFKPEELEILRASAKRTEDAVQIKGTDEKNICDARSGETPERYSGEVGERDAKHEEPT
jgi:hypothetical protein